MELFDKLNPPQKEAVNTLEGPLLILAGAGSGKTRVVTCRIVNLLRHDVSPGQILGLTFTNKAADEMKERVRSLTQNHVLISTFHSLGARILRESIDALGYKRDFTIYDEDDVDKVLKACLADLNVYDQKIETKRFRHLITQAKNSLQMPDQVSDKEEKHLPQVYACYQSKLKEYNSLDFDDLLFLTVRLFREHPAVLDMYQDRWRFLLIDEYQDTNAAQYAMVQYLVAKSRNLFVVGDPDQSIYSWRGANIRNILNFEQDYPGAKVIRLEQNYRSRTNILDAANAVVRKNYSRYEKNLWSDLGPGERIKHYTAETERSEADFVADRIRYHQMTHGIPLNQMVVFYRTNAQSRALEDCLLMRRIPYQIIGGISFYQRREVKDILAFLRMVHSGTDMVSFIRTINIPKRGLGDVTIEKIRLGASQCNMSILDYCSALVGDIPLPTPLKLSAKQKEGLRDYVGIIHSLKKIQESCSLKELVESAIERSGYVDYLRSDPESFEDRSGNLDSLIAKAIEWEMVTENPTLAVFLEELSLRSSLDESDSEKEHVNLMTIHNGKGLEFTVTFLVGLEEELFPHVNTRNSDEGLEEERRLFYVGMTRAKEFLYLTDCRIRFIWGMSRTQRPSRFIREIPFEYIEKVRLGLGGSKPPQYKPREEEEVVEEKFSDELEGPLVAGDAVFHKEFGIGVIQGVYEGSMGLTYKIIFSKDNRERSLVAKLAQLMKV